MSWYNHQYKHMQTHKENIYDIIVIWAGASGLFFCANEKHQKKLILEWSERIWTKILMAGWGRCNYTNLNANPQTYVGQNTKMLPSYFHKFWPQEMIARCKKRGIISKEEDHGRIFPITNKSQTLLDLLINEAKNNNTTILTNQRVIEILPPVLLSETKDPSTRIDSSASPLNDQNHLFTIKTQTHTFQSKKVIIATGGKTFPVTWTIGFAYNLAKKFNIKTTEKYYQTLCGINTFEDFAPLSGYTTPAKITLYHNDKALYQQERNLLFTHWWLSGPAIFNITLYLGNYCQKKNIPVENISTAKFKLEIACKDISKRLKKFMEEQNQIPLNPPLSREKLPSLTKEGLGMDLLIASPKSFRSRNEAKVTWWGILMKELTQNLESKNIPWLYFLGECLDITWETWGYNLQRCRTSAWICAKSFEKN